ncbi:MAG: DUF1254 domain-containing protein [Synergistaceae bacterium]|nr:DUF1254 domain-containing protein [Synergistaceae bacterium]
MFSLKKALREIPLFFLILILPLSMSGCTTSNNEITPDEARSIAEEAYVFAYPMLENYRSMQVQAIRPQTFNRFKHTTKLAGPDDTDIVRENNDTLYSILWLDLRTEPVVLTVPPIADRYHSFQLIDLYTHNFGYVGTRATGTGARTFAIAGPRWKGEKPTGADDLFRSETNFLLCLVRTGVNIDLTGDYEKVLAIQKQYAAVPLSAFLGLPAPKAPSMDIFPLFDQKTADSPGFITYVNFLLGQLEVHPSEKELIERFGRIGIGPDFYFDDTELSPALRTAIQEGIDSARKEIQGSGSLLGKMKNSWLLTERIFGSREQMQGKYLIRAGAARMGLYGVDLDEAYYPSSTSTQDGKPLNAHEKNYVLTFPAGSLPPVRELGFWSITMYNMPDQRMVHNPIDRYSIGDRTPGLKFDDDGSLKIYLQKVVPVEGAENWLPAPDGPFSVTMRMYLPQGKALDPLYAPPPVMTDE